jgi:hypothetical protein
MSHFTPEEFVDAIESTLPAARAAHLVSCESCRREVDAMRALVGAARSADVAAEPSPLFWPHFAARVRLATAAATGARPWAAFAWFGRVRFAVAAAAVVAVAVFAVWMTRLPVVSMPVPAGEIAEAAGPLGPLPVPDEPVPAPSAAGVAQTRPTVVAGTDDEDWRRVVTLSDRLPTDATLGVMPSAGGAALLIEDLSQPQLREFLRLLRAEQGGLR